MIPFLFSCFVLSTSIFDADSCQAGSTAGRNNDAAPQQQSQSASLVNRPYEQSLKALQAQIDLMNGLMKQMNGGTAGSSSISQPSPTESAPFGIEESAPLDIDVRLGNNVAPEMTQAPSAVTKKSLPSWHPPVTDEFGNMYPKPPGHP